MRTKRPPLRPVAAWTRVWIEGVRSPAARMVQGLISFIYPPSCAGCGLPLPAGLEDGFCPDCEQNLEWIHPPYCPACGIPHSTEASAPHLCGDCLAGAYHFDRARAKCQYRGILRDVIHRFKYQGQTFLVRPLAQMLAEPGRKLVHLHKVDLIVPVPLHRRRLRQRGFNQAALLARRLGSILETSVDYSSLKRTRWTEPQTGLSRRQRAANVQNAFALSRNEKVREKCVLLLDDVLTTGETVSQCARVLKSGGASEVLVLTVARTVTM